MAVAILMAALPASFLHVRRRRTRARQNPSPCSASDLLTPPLRARARALSGGDGVKITVPHGVEIWNISWQTAMCRRRRAASARHRGQDLGHEHDRHGAEQSRIPRRPGPHRVTSGATGASRRARRGPRQRRSTPMPATTCSPSSASTRRSYGRLARRAHGRGRGNGVRRRDARQTSPSLRGRHGRYAGPHRDPPRQPPSP